MLSESNSNIRHSVARDTNVGFRPTLSDALRATAIHGVVCFTGMLSNQWMVRDFYPIGYLR